MPQVRNDKNELFLSNFIEMNTQTLPDSLLQLKLSEVLRDARQFSMFRLYLQDICGPIHELCFLAEASRIHDSMQRKVLRDARQFSMFRLYLQDICGPIHELCFLAEASRIHDSMQRKTESSSQISYDIWQLFGQFVHSSAPDRIEFDDNIVRDFKAAIEHNDLPMLDKIIEKSYQIVYQRMQADYLISFCQSDSFFGYLCGSPPVTVNELIEQRSEQKKAVVTGGTFSLAQFRLRLRRAIAVVSYGGPLDNEESLDVTLIDDADATTNGNEFVNADTENSGARDIKESALNISSHLPSQLSLSSIDLPAMGESESISPNSGYSGTVSCILYNSQVLFLSKFIPFKIYFR
ncbi:hypothetical protein DICVIV_02413 [Dictyocaulus viviparus]|uniref:RGS domain-containing protein n=1 Tax=Dictyocaulus viviparus TaxID=29172 RepID=A0A0D8Y5Y7_DICVI|nr:hypothetical protein DICVIV_02413 [Dictyocaulus viviparus]